MASEIKTNDKIEQSAAKPAQKSSKVLFWILGGCLALIIISGIVIGGMMYWGYKKIKKEIQSQQTGIVQQQKQTANSEQDAVPMPESANQNFQEEPVPDQSSVIQPAPPEGTTQYVSEKQIGYIKKVYAKNGKNYLDIDYIQWLTGDVAEKAMREDGQCPKTGECIVFDDYYIRNQNPLIRTFEIALDAKIVMQTYDSEKTGIVGNSQEISLDQFKNIFSSGAWSHLKDVPYIVEISNQQIVKITEQYIP
jgi:hypothetical protein